MLKQILVIAGGLLLAVSLPLVALAVATDRTPPLDDSIEVVTDDATQPVLQQRLRVHAETGPPEGFEPVRQRLHQPEERVTGQQNMRHQHQSDMPEHRQTQGRNAAGSDGGAVEKPRGAGAQDGSAGPGARGQGGRGN